MLPKAIESNTFPIEESELIVNADGSIYHLALLPHQLADIVILVGDQNRVKEVSKFFSKIEYTTSNREFITHTGTVNNKQVSVISTGIGTDNIDIVINELDALVNIDLSTRLIKINKKALTLVRIGTSGALQDDIDVDKFVVSKYSVGFDGVLPFYDYEQTPIENELKQAFIEQTNWKKELNPPYVTSADLDVFNKLCVDNYFGITATANGFYGPQGRVLRLKTTDAYLNQKLTSFNYKGLRITNFEMETSALYGLANLLGHKPCTICAIVANRYKKQYSKNHHAAMDNLIEQTLQRLTI